MQVVVGMVVADQKTASSSAREGLAETEGRLASKDDSGSVICTLQL